MNGRYFTLRWKSHSRSEGHLAASENTVRIGQKADCDVRLPNPGPYADELFAVIKPTKSADGWQVIPTSEFVRTFVNGSPVGLNHYLKSGDRITFSEGASEILFEVRKGENAGTFSFTSLPHWFMAMGISAAAIAVAVALWMLIWPSVQRARYSAALVSVKESVFKITVESIFYVRTVAGSDQVIGCFSAEGGGTTLVGTAFLSSDGRLITARHCIEPWLNDNRVFTSGVSLEELPDYVVWSIEAETYNQMHVGDTSYHLVSKCTMEQENGQRMGPFLSTDFRMDRTRDEIVETGDFSTVRYCRSITGRSNRSDMMLGDFAVLDSFGLKGTITIPTEKQLGKLVSSNLELAFKGYPRRVDATEAMENGRGWIRKDYSPGHMIAHSGNITHGYSGSPVLVVNKGRAYAVGIVSTYDANDKRDNDGDMHYCYSVPILEIDRMVKP